jgi:hypothetical protein
MSDGIEFVFRPLDRWPVERTAKRRRAPFHAGYGRTLKDMERELRHLGTTRCVIQAECSEEDIRLDGRLRSSARLRGPGIILAFDSRHGPMQYPCDTYDDWTGNLRAIVLALEALRAVDRYGVTRRAEQYRGWRALPGGGESSAIAGAEWATVEEAAGWLCLQAWPAPVGNNENSRSIVRDICAGDAEALRQLYREVSMRAHPDRGGDIALMARVNRCRDYITEAMTI